MLEVIVLRVVVFLVALFVLRRIASPRRAVLGLTSVLVLLGVSSLIAFVTTAVVLGRPASAALVEWVVIYGLIALIFVARRSAGPVRPPPER